jgi:hypothetical protein
MKNLVIGPDSATFKKVDIKTMTISESCGDIRDLTRDEILFVLRIGRDIKWQFEPDGSGEGCYLLPDGEEGCIVFGIR